MKSNISLTQKNHKNIQIFLQIDILLIQVVVSVMELPNLALKIVHSTYELENGWRSPLWVVLIPGRIENATEIRIIFFIFVEQRTLAGGANLFSLRAAVRRPIIGEVLEIEFMDQWDPLIVLEF